jgi:transcriptional regulator with XRE-family HTH domain
MVEEKLKDPEFVFYFHRERAIKEIARMVRSGRERAGLTQQALAERSSTTQAVIARLESGTDRRTPSLDLLDRIARAPRARLLIQFEPIAA